MVRQINDTIPVDLNAKPFSVIADTEGNEVNVEGGGLLGSVMAALKYILNVLQRPLWMNVSTGSIRLVDTLTTVTGATVTTMTAVGGIAAYDSMMIIPMRNNWNNGVRARIS